MVNHRKRLVFLIVGFVGAALVAGIGVWKWRSAPPGPDLFMSVLTDLKSGDEAFQIGCRVLYDRPDGRIYLILLWPGPGDKEVEIRVADDAVLVDHKLAGVISSETLQPALSLATTEQGRLLAQDLAVELARIGTLPFDPSGDTIRVRRWTDTSIHDPSLWYGGRCAIKLYPPGMKFQR